MVITMISTTNCLLFIANYAWSRPWLSIGMAVGLTMLLGVGVGQLKNDPTSEAFFSKDTDVYIALEKFQQQFGRDDVVVVAVETDQVFSASLMRQVRQLHQDLEEQVPWVEDVVSPINSDWIKAKKNNVINVSDLADIWPEEGELPPALQQEILSSPLYSKRLISADGSMLLLFLRTVAFTSPENIARAKQLAHQSQLSSPLGFSENLKRWHDNLHADEHSTDVDSTAGNNASSNLSSNTKASLLNPLTTVSGLSPQETSFFGEQDLDQKDNGVVVHKLLNAAQRSAFTEAIESVVDHHRQQGLTLRIAGGPYLEKKHSEVVHGDILLLLGVSLLFIIALLVLLVRTVMGVMLPVVVILLGLLSCLGAMGWGAVPITAVSMAVAPLIIVVAVLDTIHIMGIYYRRLSEGCEPKAAIAAAFEHSGMAILFTSLTTVMGFISFMVIDIQPVADLGWVAAFGTSVVLLYATLLLPATIRLSTQKNTASRESVQQKSRALLLSTQWLNPCVNIGLRYPWRVMAVMVLLIVMAAPGVMQSRFSFDIVRWFPEGLPIRTDTLAIDKKIPATVPLEIVIDTGRKEGLLQPKILETILTFERQAEGLSNTKTQVGRATSLVDYLSRIHLQLAPNSPTLLPDSEALIHQELLLYEASGSRQLDRLADRGYQMARITLQLAWADAYDLKELQGQITTLANDTFKGIAEVRISGKANLIAASSVLAIDGLKESYLLAAIVITLMLTLLWRSPSIGILSMLPNFLPAYFGLALMGYMDIPITFATVLLGGISLGLAVDDSVHLIHNIKQGLKQGLSIGESVRNTIVEIGPILVTTTAILAIGFSVFMFSSIGDFADFGAILSLVMVLALVLDVFLIPAVMQLVYGEHALSPVREIKERSQL